MRGVGHSGHGIPLDNEPTGGEWKTEENSANEIGKLKSIETLHIRIEAKLGGLSPRRAPFRTIAGESASVGGGVVTGRTSLIKNEAAVSLASKFESDIYIVAGKASPVAIQKLLARRLELHDEPLFPGSSQVLSDLASEVSQDQLLSLIHI